jgi:hypothetical protein
MEDITGGIPTAKPTPKAIRSETVRPCDSVEELSGVGILVEVVRVSFTDCEGLELVLAVAPGFNMVPEFARRYG